MTSTKTTTSVIRPVVLFLLGLALSVFGVFHAVNRYPGPDVFVRFTDALPMLGAVASFALGVAAALAGLVLVLPMVFRLRRRRQSQPPVYLGSRNPYADRGLPVPRPVPVRHGDEDFDPQGFGDDDHLGTGSGYGGAYGGSYPDNHHDNGEYDQRRQADSFR
jgi:hypothetical protein